MYWLSLLFYRMNITFIVDIVNYTSIRPILNLVHFKSIGLLDTGKLPNRFAIFVRYKFLLVLIKCK